MKRRIYLFLSLFILINKLIAQNDDGRLGFYNINLNGLNIKFYNYVGYKVNGTLKEFNTTDLQTPEGLMWSYESCNTQEWYDKLRVTSSKFSKNKTFPEKLDSNYIQLLNKILFSSNGSDYCIVKFHIKRSDKKFPINYHLPACLSMQKINGSWKFISTPGFLSPYYNLMFGLQSKYLFQLFIESKCGEPVIDKIIQNSKQEGVLNIGKFYFNYIKLFEGDHKNDSTIQKVIDNGYTLISKSEAKVINEFKIITNTIASIRFYEKEYTEPLALYKGLTKPTEGANFALLQLINKSDQNNTIGALFKNIAPNDTSKNIAMTYKMELEFMGTTYALIKYRIKKGSKTSFSTVCMKKTDGNFNYSILPKELKDLNNVINQLKPKYMNKISGANIIIPNYIEYYPIKEKSIDESGQLNITLLNSTLDELQKSNLSLYMKVSN